MEEIGVCLIDDLFWVFLEFMNFLQPMNKQNQQTILMIGTQVFLFLFYANIVVIVVILHLGEFPFGKTNTNLSKSINSAI
jgi:hypothetical protein